MAGQSAPNPYPALPAAPPTFGLLASLPVVKSGRWQGGISYTPEGCVNGTTRDLYTVGQKTPTARPAAVTWYPYILSVFEKCSTFSGTEDNMARARRALLADSERQLGRELWSGTISSGTLPDTTAYPNKWLTKAPLVLEAAPLPPLQGLYCLDAYLGRNNSGQQGIIHAPIEAFDTWKSLQAIQQEADGKWYSPTGHLIIASPGYPGTGPDSRSYPAGLWAYATDMVRVFMEDIVTPTELRDAVDRRDNTVQVLAERRALAEWSLCRQAGVEMSITTCDLV